jgi:DNA-binding XRE family transcriptional regulator
MDAMARGMASTLGLVARSARKSGKLEDSDPQYGALRVPSDGAQWVSDSVASVVIIFPEHPQRDFFGGDRIEVLASDILEWQGSIAPIGVQQALRHEINRLGLRQHKLAGLLHVSPSQLSNLQRGRYGASAELAERIRNFLIGSAKTVGGGTLPVDFFLAHRGDTQIVSRSPMTTASVNSAGRSD